MIPMSKYVNPGVDIITARNVYGGAGGPSVGQIAGGLTPYSAQVGGVSQSAVITDGGETVSAGDNSNAAALASTSLFGRPVTWWLVLLAIVLGVMFVARKYSGGEGGATFAAIKPSFYNMFAITGNAVVGIVLLKLLFNKVQVPGLTPLINAV
jgi:hypothetical protein